MCIDMIHLTGCMLTSTFSLCWSARLTSWRQMQKQQQAKDAAAAAAAAAEAAPTAAAEAASSGPADSGPQKNNLVHAWVMVLAGKREVTRCRTHLTSSAIMQSWTLYTLMFLLRVRHHHYVFKFLLLSAVITTCMRKCVVVCDHCSQTCSCVRHN